MNCKLMAQVSVLMTLLVACADNARHSNNADRKNFEERPPLKQQEIEQKMTPNDFRSSGSIELPASMIAPAVTNLGRQLGVNESDIQILRATSVIWNNGAAGCPKPGVAYTQALVPGFWVVLGHAGKHYSYHATRKGLFQLCENATPKPVGEPPHGRLNSDV